MLNYKFVLDSERKDKYIDFIMMWVFIGISHVLYMTYGRNNALFLIFDDGFC